MMQYSKILIITTLLATGCTSYQSYECEDTGDSVVDADYLLKDDVFDELDISGEPNGCGDLSLGWSQGWASGAGVLVRFHTETSVISSLKHAEGRATYLEYDLAQSPASATFAVETGQYFSGVCSDIAYAEHEVWHTWTAVAGTVDLVIVPLPSVGYPLADMVIRLHDVVLDGNEGEGTVSISSHVGYLRMALGRTVP